MPESAKLLQSHGFAPLQAELLGRRGITDREAADRFLNPSPDQFHDPYLLAGMDRAIERLVAARDGQEKVAIVGDYDVDGVSATALLDAVFGACGIATLAIVPHRMKEGYGFQPVHVERALQEGCGVVVTADCGTTSVAAVGAAIEGDLDVIVTDHHLPGAGFPEQALQINPKQEHCHYPYPELCGAGLALKLCLALLDRCGRKNDLHALLRIACLGTIADMVPLTEENRAIAALGLKALGDTRSAGLRALIHQSGVRLPVTAEDVGFRLGPRLNAAGRLGSAESALELLLCRDVPRAAELASQLDQWNKQRQGEELRVVEQARERIAGQDPLPPILVAWDESWHRGVVGIAAGRLMREFQRPTLLFALDGESAVGSGRSLSGVDLHGFLSEWKDDMDRFGGHSQAVGLTVAKSSLEDLRSQWQEEAQKWPPHLFERIYEYELTVAPRDVTDQLLDELEALQPHGQQNPQPLLRVGPLNRSGSLRFFGKDHLSGQAKGPQGAPVRLLGWRWRSRASELTKDFEVLAYLERDTYRGGPVLRLVDCRPA
ncbi:MAG: single-stranded-DNA-specific exonuclease RecJ [Deltaproteobacteria bacterium]|nr:single-stranded-DNA-specific exonuclease RecJ [Deltaproteobacteria bacterium]